MTTLSIEKSIPTATSTATMAVNRLRFKLSIRERRRLFYTSIFFINSILSFLIAKTVQENLGGRKFSGFIIGENEKEQMYIPVYKGEK